MKKIFVIIICLLMIFIMTSCDSDVIIDGQDTTVTTLSSIFGTDVFNQNDEIQVYFFDTYNSYDEEGNSIDTKMLTVDEAEALGYIYKNNRQDTTNTAKPSDCYLIKSGTIELLVDGGYHTNANVESIRKNCHTNLLRKIATLIDPSGVLDFVIVTHADYDHIASLIIDGGIFDAFCDYDTYNKTYGEIKPLNGKSFDGFKGIGTIIDFNSGLVSTYSDVSIEKEKRLITSDAYQTYKSCISKLIENGTNYLPAAALFCDENIEDVEIDVENKEKGVPKFVNEQVKKAREAGVTIELLLKDNPGSQGVHNSSYKENVNKLIEKGAYLASTTSNVDKLSRYYFTIPFDSAELRILYNWHYDYIWHGSFNGGSYDTKEKYDSQDANNISVCFEVIYKEFKFLSTGDLGGNGENGILNYYNGTNVLKNVSCFKSSHHGSTYNGENSKELYEEMKPCVVIITGIALTKNMQNDNLFKYANVYWTEEIFENIKSGNPNAFISATNICHFNGGESFSASPFYGDIYVSGKKGNVKFACSNISNSKKTQIDSYININDGNYHFCFNIRENGKILSINETKWYNKQMEIGMSI